MNTYLSAKPGFTSPQPLAAASSLTIPLQITLSEIKLSAFIIVVFSKQKGLTLVFRNDPLESLKVSSTFDSIQFVRDYLQRTIEVKLRDLMMEELPAIIHRLSLQLWCPDQIIKDGEEDKEDDDHAVNPLATPPLDAVDAHGHTVCPIAISELSLDPGSETKSLYSQQNVHQLGSLVDTQGTSSLFTSDIQNVMFRAWAVPSERPDSNSPPAATPSLVRSASHSGSAHTYTFSDSGSQDTSNLPSRPSLVSMNSATTAGLSLGSGRHTKAGRKKKMRVVNLRKPSSEPSSSEMGDDASEEGSSSMAPMSEPDLPATILEQPEEGPSMASSSNVNKARFPSDVPQQRRPSVRPEQTKVSDSPIPSIEINSAPISSQTAAQREPVSSDIKAEWRRSRPQFDTQSVILEQAWIMKMAGEIARRVYDEKNRNPAFWAERDDFPPPAYEAN